VTTVPEQVIETETFTTDNPPESTQKIVLWVLAHRADENGTARHIHRNMILAEEVDAEVEAGASNDPHTRPTQTYQCRHGCRRSTGEPQ
jgi:hypothetical protein